MTQIKGLNKLIIQKKGMEWILWRELTDVPNLFSLRASAQREKVRKGERIS